MRYYATLGPACCDAGTLAALLCRGVTGFRLNLSHTPLAARTDWIAALRNAGIGFMIVSNNRSGTRVTEFCADLGIGYQGHAGKPSPKGLRAAMERTGTDPAHTAMLGDKLLTDMLAAHRAGVRAWMVEPLGGPVGLWNHVLHLLQRPFKRACPYKDQKKPGENTKYPEKHLQ